MTAASSAITTCDVRHQPVLRQQGDPEARQSGRAVRNVASAELFTEGFSAAVDYVGLLPSVERERIGVIYIATRASVRRLVMSFSRLQFIGDTAAGIVLLAVPASLHIPEPHPCTD